MKIDDFTINITLDIPDETISYILKILEIWQNNNVDKRIVCEEQLCEDGYTYHFWIEKNLSIK